MSELPDEITIDITAEDIDNQSAVSPGPHTLTAYPGSTHRRTPQ